jgi:hypothetical protein
VLAPIVYITGDVLKKEQTAQGTCINNSICVVPVIRQSKPSDDVLSKQRVEQAKNTTGDYDQGLYWYRDAFSLSRS